MPVTTSYAMVPSFSAQSAAVISSPPWAPSSTTSSPISTGESPTSTISWSIVTVPAIGQRRPRDEHLAALDAEVARHAVGVPDRDGGDVARPRQLVLQTVGEAVPGRERLHVGDAGPQRQHRPQPHVVGDARRGGDAVERDAGTDEVVARGRVREQRSRVGRVREARLAAVRAERCEQLVEAAELLHVVRVVGLVGDGEVRAHALEVELGAGADRPRRAAAPPRASTRRDACRCRP